MPRLVNFFTWKRINPQNTFCVSEFTSGYTLPFDSLREMSWYSGMK